MTPLSIAFFLSATGPGGGAKVLLEHARRLAARGHATTLVVPPPREPPAWFDHGRPVVRAVPAGVDLVVATRYRDLAPAFAQAKGTPVVHLVQGDDDAGPEAVLAAPHGLRGLLGRLRARRKLARAGAALALPTVKVAVSTAIAARLRERGHAPLLAENGIDDAVFAPGPARPVARPARIVIAGPTTGPTKGIAAALTVLARVRGTTPLVVAHLTPRAEDASRDADERRSGLDERQVAELLRGADVFLSLATEAEGFDLPALEALATGVPCVLSDTAAHRALAPGEAALRVPLDDAPAAAAAVLAALDRRAALAAAGRAAAEARSWDRAIVAVEAAYREAARRA